MANTLEKAKKAAGYAAAELVKDGMKVGLGTGTTAYFFIEALGKRCCNGLKIKALASSERSRCLAESLGIPLIKSQDMVSLDFTADGADEITRQKTMIKGGGGALAREKILAASSKEFVVIVDEKKLVNNLGLFPLPVEIFSFAYLSTLARLEKKGYQCTLRQGEADSPYMTDNGNYIVDLSFSMPIDNPWKEHQDLCSIPGVIETGLFFDLAHKVIVGYENESIEVLS